MVMSKAIHQDYTLLANSLNRVRYFQKMEAVTSPLFKTVLQRGVRTTHYANER